MSPVESTIRAHQTQLSSVPTESSQRKWKISASFDPSIDVVLHTGDTTSFLGLIPSGSIGLVVSSPPYNLGKEYEVQTKLHTYLDTLKPVLHELVRVLKPEGSLCWQVGNYIENGEVFPLDIYYYPLFKQLELKLRNRMVWHFGHGLHASRRFSGRYETLLWFTKSDEYVFNLDAVRVVAKYPGKTHYRGPKRGQISGNPLGKNPSDFWEFLQDEWNSGLWDIPNVKSNHPEKTIHPCQFPIELVERCVLALTNPGDYVLDPYGGVGSAAIAALKNGRRAISVDKEPRYVEIARQRIRDLERGELTTRKLGTPVYQPSGNEKAARIPAEWSGGRS
nr:site-specific DNA-methyltransferase [Ferrimicrobium acidiphilum]